MRRFADLAALMALALAACDATEPAAETAASGAADSATACAPVETRAPNVPSQEPAFEGQTRACAIESDTSAYRVAVVARGLEHPWAVEPLPDGDLLVTERPGRMRIVSAMGEVGRPLSGIPRVDARGQGGLLDVALSPSFATDSTIYWSYAEPRPGGNGTSVARGILSEDRSRMGRVEVIYRGEPTYQGTMHFGSRLAFGPDGMLYLTMGDRSDEAMRMHAQRLDNHLGKIVRLAPDGSIPPDNPFVGDTAAVPGVWTLGHRNVQAAAFDPDGDLWIVEHGARGGDELNRIQKGNNYGWPLVAYGEEYSGRPIEGAATARDGYEQPVYYWDPVIAPSGAEFYEGDAFPAWRGDLFIGSLRDERLVRLRLDGGRVTGEEHLLTDRNQRVRDVREGRDGALYLVTDEPNGELWRIEPRR